MRNVIGERTVTELDYGYTCDCCGKELEEVFEFQEMLHWENRGGYGSVFGDGADMTLDLCQDCIKKLLEPYIRFHVTNF